jgi:hypothetical protein
MSAIAPLSGVQRKWYSSSGSSELNLPKYDAESKKCIDSYIRDFVRLPNLLSAMAGQGERQLGLVAWGFFLIPLALLWIVVWGLRRIGYWVAAGYDGLRDVIARIPKRATTVLTSSKRRPWTPDGFGSSFNDAKHAAGIADKDLHFHDLRGTAATKFYIAGLPIRVIAEVLAWGEDQVERIIRRYVERAAATKAAIRQLNEVRKRT